MVLPQDLFELIRQNDFKEIKKYKNDVNIRDENKATPLMWAVYSSDLKMVKLLVSKNADPKLKGWIFFTDSNTWDTFMYGSCLVIAAGENKPDILEYLIKKLDIPADDKEINMYENKENGWNAIQWASFMGNNKIIEYLISTGVDINSPAETDSYQTPVMFAISNNKLETVKYLTEKNANLNTKDIYGNTPLLYAFHYNNKEIIKYLIRHGAETGIKNMTAEDLIFEYFGISDVEKL